MESFTVWNLPQHDRLPQPSVSVEQTDDYAEKIGMPPAEEHPVEELESALMPGPRRKTETDLSDAGFAWIDLPGFNEAGEPLHRRGVTQRPGLYFPGLRRTHSVSSTLLAGVGNDAAFLAEHIATR